MSTSQLLAAAGLQTRVKRVGGGYREVPYSADELLGVAASLGNQLRAIADERDKAMDEREALEASAAESDARAEVIERLEEELARLRAMDNQVSKALAASRLFSPLRLLSAHLPPCPPCPPCAQS